MPELQLRIALYKSEISNSARIFFEISRKCATLIGCCIVLCVWIDRQVGTLNLRLSRVQDERMATQKSSDLVVAMY